MPPHDQRPLAPPPSEDWLRPAPSPMPKWVVPATLAGISALLIGLYVLGSDLSQLAVLLGTLPITAGLLGYFVFRQHRFARAIADARQLLATRRLDEAAAAFEALCREHRRPVAHHAEAVSWYGVTSLLRADIPRALSCLSVVESTPGVAGWAAVYEPLAGWIALAYVAAGRDADAQAWVEEAKRRSDAVSVVISLLPEACLMLRRGDGFSASRLLTRAWDESQVALAAPILHELRLVRAFALDMIGPDAQQREEQGLLLKGLGHDPREYDWLTVSWPALQGFVRARL